MELKLQTPSCEWHPEDADERLAVDLKGLWKVHLKQIWKENDRHWETYTVFLYVRISSAILLKIELSK
jgi:hypothetical protein